MQNYAYVAKNLEIKEKNELHFPYMDYGFLYGYGLFETLHIKDGRPILLSEHYKRMKRGSIILEMPFNYTEEEVQTSVQALIEKNNAKDAILNIYLTPGDRESGSLETSFNEVLMLKVLRPMNPALVSSEQRLIVQEESFQRTPINRLKTLSYIKNILERLV